jgi:ABC-type transporter Mla subunit MlaD
MLETLLVNGALAGLLLATLVYAIKLNRRMGDLRRGRAELDQAVQRFAAASADADRTMARLADLTNGQGRNLQEALKKSGGMVDDLKFLIERADTAADRLEAAVAQSRRAQSASPMPAPVAAAATISAMPAAPAANSTRPAAPTAKPVTTGAPMARSAVAVATEVLENTALPEHERRLLNALIGLR